MIASRNCLRNLMLSLLYNFGAIFMRMIGPLAKQKPVVFFSGNCQAQYLAAVFAHSNLVESYAIGVDRGFLPSYGGETVRYLSDDAAGVVAAQARSESREVIAATQVSNGGPVDGGFSGADREIKFPFLAMKTINPGASGSSGDRELMRRLVSDNIKTMLRTQKLAGTTRLDYAEVVQHQFRYWPLFHSFLHPGATLSAMLVEDVAAQIGGPVYEKMRPIIAEILSTEGMNFVSDHPMSKADLEAFGCQWPWYELYRYIVIGSRQDESEYVLGNARVLGELFGHETIYWQAIMRSHVTVGNFDEARAASRELEYRSPGYIRTWFNRIDLERKAGSGADAVDEIVNSATTALRNGRQSLHLKALAAMRVGEPERGLEAARQYHEAAPDILLSVRPLIRILVCLDRQNEAVNVLRSSSSMLSQPDRATLLASLRDVPQIVSKAG